jgi:hypothetical protein
MAMWTAGPPNAVRPRRKKRSASSATVARAGASVERMPPGSSPGWSRSVLFLSLGAGIGGVEPHLEGAVLRVYGEAIALPISWTKKLVDDWSATVGPLSVKIQPKGDGRYNWQVFKGDALNPMATGVANSLGAAKTVVEQFVNRSGLV